MDAIVIGAATEDDIPALMELQKQWQGEGITWGLVPDTRETLLKYVRACFCYVARLSDRLIGFATAQVLLDAELAALPAGAPCLEPMDLYVLPAFRSRGTGGELLDSLLDHAREQGIAHVKLWSGTKDTRRIMGFYERHGFRLVGVQMGREL